MNWAIIDGNVTDNCPVCSSPKEKFQEMENAIVDPTGEENMVELEKDLYKHLSENNLIKLDDINESVGFDFLQEGKYIVTDQLEDLNGNVTAEVGDVVYTTENQKPFDNYFGVNLYHVINEDTKKQVMVSEDNIERIKL